MHNLRRILFLLVLISGKYAETLGQAVPNSVIRQYESAKTDKEKLHHLYSLEKPQSDSSFSQKSVALIDFRKSVNDTRTIDLIQLGINNAFYVARGDKLDLTIATNQQLR